MYLRERHKVKTKEQTDPEKQLYLGSYLSTIASILKQQGNVTIARADSYARR